MAKFWHGIMLVGRSCPLGISQYPIHQSNDPLGSPSIFKPRQVTEKSRIGYRLGRVSAHYWSPFESFLPPAVDTKDNCAVSCLGTLALFSHVTRTARLICHRDLLSRLLGRSALDDSPDTQSLMTVRPPAKPRGALHGLRCL